MHKKKLIGSLAAAAVLATVLPLTATNTAAAADFHAENFDSLSSELGPRVDETHLSESLMGFTHTAPTGWTITNSDSLLKTDDQGEPLGVAEWHGWSFTTPEFWSKAAPGQGRENFKKASGVFAVADNDEWDDNMPATAEPHPGDDIPGSGEVFTSVLTSPKWDVEGGSTVHVNFDSNYRQTGPQVGALEVSFDGGETTRLFEYSTESIGNQTHLENRTITQPIEVPEGATSMQVSWVIEKATNDWYWAIDNITVSDTPREGAEDPMPPAPPSAGDTPDGISDKKVLLIDFDGVRLDMLREYHTPNMDALADGGQFGVSYLHDNKLGPTVSGNAHATILTGVWADKHRSYDNNFTDVNVDEFPDVLTRLEQANPDFSTFSTLDWTPINTHLIGEPDVKLQQSGGGTKVTDKASTDEAVDSISNYNPDALYVYLHDGDAAGHAHTAESPEYKETIELLDVRVGELVDAIKSRETYEQEDWLILATTDHGFTGYGHGGDQHLTRKVWILANGGDIPTNDEMQREWRIADIAPTILDHMGVEIDPKWALDGIVIGTESTDPFDTLEDKLQGVVDEAPKPPVDGPYGQEPSDIKGWTKETPKGWSIDEQTAAVGTTEYRGWNFMSGEFWTTSQEGEGRGSFVRGRDIIAVADPDEWNDKDDPAASGERMNSTLWSPWQKVKNKDKVTVSFNSQYRQLAGVNQGQSVAVVAEFKNGDTQILWHRDSADGELFEIGREINLEFTSPPGGREVRIGWAMIDGGENGYWAIDNPQIQAGDGDSGKGGSKKPGKPKFPWDEEDWQWPWDRDGWPGGR